MSGCAGRRPGPRRVLRVAAMPWRPPQQQAASSLPHCLPPPLHPRRFFDYQQPGSAEGYDPQQQQQQYGSSAYAQWYYGDNGQYQVADYPVPGSAGSDAGRGAFASSRGRSDGGGPAEFVFPTSYGDDASGAPGDGSWGAPGEGQQPQWGPPGQQQQQQPPPAAPGRGGSGYEMDDW